MKGKISLKKLDSGTMLESPKSKNIPIEPKHEKLSITFIFTLPSSMYYVVT